MFWLFYWSSLVSLKRLKRKLSFKIIMILVIEYDVMMSGTCQAIVFVDQDYYNVGEVLRDTRYWLLLLFYYVGQFLY